MIPVRLCLTLYRVAYGYWIAEPFRIALSPVAESILNLGRNVAPSVFLFLSHSMLRDGKRLPSPFMHAAKGGMAVPVGSLDDDPVAESVVQIYAEHEAPWLARTESAPRLTSAQIRNYAEWGDWIRDA